MAKTTSAHYASPSFTYAGATTDTFNITDLGSLGQAMDAHDHSSNKGVAIPAGGLAAGACTGAALGSDVATLTGSQNLTNKTITSAVYSGTHSGVPGGRFYYNTTFAATTGAWTALSFNTARWNVGTVWVVGTPTQMKPAVAGVYLVGGSICFAPSASGVIRGVGIRLNGSTFYGQIAESPINSVSLGNSMDVSGLIYLNGSTDYVEVCYYTDQAMTMPGETGSTDGFGASGFCILVGNNA